MKILPRLDMMFKRFSLVSMLLVVLEKLFLVKPCSLASLVHSHSCMSQHWLRRDAKRRLKARFAIAAFLAHCDL